MSEPTPTAVGITTISWGTAPGGTQVAAVYTGVIVSSAKFTPHNKGPVSRIQNGDGAVVSKFYLDDGFDLEVEYVLDTSKTQPRVGQAITITLPVSFDIGNAGTASASYTCTVDSPALTFERKKETMVALQCSYDPGCGQ